MWVAPWWDWTMSELLRDGIISSTWSYYFTLFRVQCLWAAPWWIISSTWSCYFTLFRVQCLWAGLWWDYIQYMVMLFQIVPCTMSVSCSVMGLYPVNGHIISRCSVCNVCKLLCDGLYPVHGHVISSCSVYNVCELLCDGIISSTWSCYFTLFRVQCL